jgi:hypothetical protein
LARREALGKGIGALFSEPEEKGGEGEKAPVSGVITQESGVVSKEPSLTSESEVDSKESRVITSESEVHSNKSAVVTDESGVVSDESVVISKGKGVIAGQLELDNKESRVVTPESEVGSKELGVVTSDRREGKEKILEARVAKGRQRSPTLKIGQSSGQVDEEVLEQAISEALKSPRISTWSPLVMSALRYLQLTTARFSMSREVSETLEAAFREKYPNLFERIEKEIEKS